MTNEIKIFLAEDNYADALFLQKILEKAKVHYSLTRATDGESALQMLSHTGDGTPPPDVVFLDIKLPRLNGLELLRQLQQSGFSPDVPIVMLTGSDDPDDVARAAELGVRYMKKPPKIEDLLSVMNLEIPAESISAKPASSRMTLERAARAGMIQGSDGHHHDGGWESRGKNSVDFDGSVPGALERDPGLDGHNHHADGDFTNHDGDHAPDMVTDKSGVGRKISPDSTRVNGRIPADHDADGDGHQAKHRDGDGARDGAGNARSEGDGDTDGDNTLTINTHLGRTLQISVNENAYEQRQLRRKRMTERFLLSDGSFAAGSELLHRNSDDTDGNHHDHFDADEQDEDRSADHNRRPPVWKLLLVEDNINDVQIACTLLNRSDSDEHYAISVVHDLKSALAELQHNEYDVIALDLQLPDSVGIQTFRRLHKIVSSTPIVVVTGSDEKNLGQRAVTDGAQDFVVKASANYGEILARSIRYAIHRKRGEELGKRVERTEANEHFMALLAHELRAPIAGANNVLQHIAERRLGDLNDSQVEMLNRVIHSQEKTLGMIADILDVYVFEKDMEKLNFEETDLSILLEVSAYEMKPKADLHNIRIRTFYDDGLPSIQLNRKSIHRVISNLIDNAIKFGPTRSTINIFLEAEDDFLKVTVQDFGEGLSEAKRERLFKKFWQGAVRHHYNPGLGQGLYYSKMVVDAHFGSIHYNHDNKLGTTFTIELPVHRPSDKLMQEMPTQESLEV